MLFWHSFLYFFLHLLFRKKIGKQRYAEIAVFAINCFPLSVNVQILTFCTINKHFCVMIKHLVLVLAHRLTAPAANTLLPQEWLVRWRANATFYRPPRAVAYTQAPVPSIILQPCYTPHSLSRSASHCWRG